METQKSKRKIAGLMIRPILTFALSISVSSLIACTRTSKTSKGQAGDQQSTTSKLETKTIDCMTTDARSGLKIFKPESHLDCLKVGEVYFIAGRVKSSRSEQFDDRIGKLSDWGPYKARLIEIDPQDTKRMKFDFSLTMTGLDPVAASETRILTQAVLSFSEFTEDEPLILAENPFFAKAQTNEIRFGSFVSSSDGDLFFRRMILRENFEKSLKAGSSELGDAKEMVFTMGPIARPLVEGDAIAILGEERDYLVVTDSHQLGVLYYLRKSAFAENPEAEEKLGGIQKVIQAIQKAGDQIPQHEGLIRSEDVVGNPNE